MLAWHEKILEDAWKGVSFFSNSVLSICPPTSSSLFFLFLPQTRNVIHTSLIPLSSPSLLSSLTLFALISMRHLLSPCNSWLLCTAHALCVTVDPFGFLVWENPRCWARSLCRLRVANTWEGFYLLGDVVDPGWRAVAKIRSLGFPDTIRCKTPESCNTCNRKVCSVWLAAFCLQHPMPKASGSLLVLRSWIGHFWVISVA